MATHWFLRENHSKFRNSIASVIDEAVMDLSRHDARDTLGDEHTQCQHLFTKIYTLMRGRQQELTEHLLCCSKVRDPVVELRYYRSPVRRSRSIKSPQFIESETGADFALTLQIDLPDILQAERSVLGQAKVLDSPSAQFNEDQLNKLLDVGGPESATYMLWRADYPPTIVSAENIESHIRTQGASRLGPLVFTLGKPLAEFFCDGFLGLWFGKDYDPKKECEEPPPESIGILYHFLHRGTPPPNVVHFGLSSRRELRVRPGVYIDDIVDIP